MTLTHVPDSYASAHYDIFFVVSDAKASDPVTYPNYKYVADLYINGTLVNRLRRVPNPVSFYGVFNVGAIVRNYFTVAFAASGTLVSMEQTTTQFSNDIQLKFGEEYGATTTYNIVTDAVRTVYNYYTRIPTTTNAPLVNFTDKIVTNGYKINSPLTTFKALVSTDFLMVNYFPTTTTAISFSVVGNTTYSTTVTPAHALELLTLNISPAVLNALQPGIITSALDYYTVTIGSETIRVKLFCEAIYNVYPVHFLNQYGGFETKIFNKVSRQNIKVDKKSFGILPYQLTSGGAITYKSGSFTFLEADYDYATNFTNQLTLNSDVLTDKDFIWLEDLIESPLVYIQTNGFFYPVKVTNTDYEIKKNINETDLSNLTIVVDYGRVFNTQYR